MAKQDVETNLEAALEAAASDEEPDKSSLSDEAKEAEAKAAEAAAEADKKVELEPTKPRGHKGANDRIQDLLDQNKTTEEKAAQIEETLAERDEEIGKLVDLLKLRDNDAAVVAKINELHQSDPELKDLIETLDKAIQGQEFEMPEKGKEGEKPEGEAEVLAKAKELLKEHESATEERLAEQADELILHKADLLTDAYIAELPDEYNDEDQYILRSVLVDHINWDQVEQNPEALPEAFAEGFQSALDWYKTPKGKAAPVPEGEGNETATAEPMTEKKLTDFAGQDWGKLNSVETPDGKTLNPEVSDEDFTAALAQAMKAENKLSG